MCTVYLRIITIYVRRQRLLVCIQICVAEACQAVGSRDLVAAVEKKLGKKIDETHADVEIKSAYCFGNCALSPAAMVDGELVGRATVEKVTA
jgi:formate dehydrogenase subunit gamma